jgi:hypothetical protein
LGGNVTDEGVTSLARLPNLEWLELRGTKITDAAIPSLQQMKSLKRVDLGHTDVSLQAILAWRSAASAAGLIIATNKEPTLGNLLPLAIRWLDGRFSLDSPREELAFDWEGPLDSLSSKQFSLPPRQYVRGRLGNLANLSWDPSQFTTLADGDYRLCLRLGDHASDPVTISMASGQPSPTYVEFQMPVTKQQALGEKP